MTRTAIVVGSTRPHRTARPVADRVHEHAAQRTDARLEPVDIVEQNRPLLDEPMPPAMGQYSTEHAKVWAQKVASYAGFVFVTAEYSHSVPAAPKNAVDFLYAELEQQVGRLRQLRQCRRHPRGGGLAADRGGTADGRRARAGVPALQLGLRGGLVLPAHREGH